MVDEVKQLMSDGISAPLGDVIASVGRGVAEAQAALDHASLEQTLALYGTEGDAALQLLRDIGYRPTFYVLPETSCEVQVSLRVGGSGSSDGSAGAPPSDGRPNGVAGLARTRMYVTPVDAGFANRYGYSAQASAKLSFKIVPVPPPAALDDARPTPKLVGRTVADASAVLASLGLSANFADTSGKALVESPSASFVVKAQSPGPLTLVPIGSVITLTAGTPG